MRHYPIEPLLQLCEDVHGPGVSDVEIATQCNVSIHAVKAWKRRGRISRLAADRAAVALGYTPRLIWQESEHD